jgi:hypothetical protein
MFLVLLPPFAAGLDVEPKSLSCLVYESHKGVRVIVSALTHFDLQGRSMVEWHTAVAEALNEPPSLEYVRLMLRSIKQTWQRGAIYRQEAVWRRNNPPREYFRADFGRLDFSRPGRGGHGFDDGQGGY